MAQRRRVPPIRGKVVRLPREDNDGLFPFHKQLANKSPTIPPSHIPLLKPGLQVFYELCYKGHNETSQPNFKKILEKEHDDNKDDHLTSPKFADSFIDALTPKDLRLHCGFWQACFPGMGIDTNVSNRVHATLQTRFVRPSVRPWLGRPIGHIFYDFIL